MGLLTKLGKIDKEAEKLKIILDLQVYLNHVSNEKSILGHSILHSIYSGADHEKIIAELKEDIDQGNEQTLAAVIGADLTIRIKNYKINYRDRKM